ncbi:MAG: hypothetical protein ACRC4T_19725 [Cetobacterium sp.]
MKPTKCDDVINLLNESESYLYQQEKLFILIEGKTYIIHNVNQKSHEHILKNSILDPSRVSKKYARAKPREWTPEEEKVVLENPKLSVLEELLPYRTKDSIRHKLHKMRTREK